MRGQYKTNSHVFQQASYLHSLARLVHALVNLESRLYYVHANVAYCFECWARKQGQWAVTSWTEDILLDLWTKEGNDIVKLDEKHEAPNHCVCSLLWSLWPEQRVLSCGCWAQSPRQRKSSTNGSNQGPRGARASPWEADDEAGRGDRGREPRGIHNDQSCRVTIICTCIVSQITSFISSNYSDHLQHIVKWHADWL